VPRQARTATRPAARSFLAPVIAIFLIALVVRLVHMWSMHHSPFFDALLGDARSYDAWGHRIAAGDVIGHEVFYQAPLYAYFLGAIYACGGNLLAVRVCQAVVGAGACALLARAGERLFGRGAGIAAGLMLALYAPAIFFDGLIQKSVIDTFLVSLLLTLLADLMADATSAERPPVHRRWRWLSVGAVIGALGLTRENALIFAPVLLAWIWWGLQGSKSVRALAATLVVTGAFAVLLPVGVRNAIVGGEFHLTTVQSGPNFFIGNQARADGTYIPLRPGRGSPEYEQADAAELASRAAGRQLSAGEVSRYWTGRALDDIRSHPVDWVRLETRKVRLLWNDVEVLDTESQESHEDDSPVLFLLAHVARFGVLVPLACLGLWISWDDRGRLWLLYAMTAAYSLSVLAFYVVARYRLPIVPILMLFAAVAVVRARAFVFTLKPAGAIAGLAVMTVVTVWSCIPVVSADAMRAASYQNLGTTFLEAGRLDEAVEAFNHALALEPDYAPAHNSLGSVLRQQGHHDEAIAQLEAALRLQPAFDDARFNLANARADRGDWARAIAEYEAILRRRPDAVDVQSNLGIALASANRPVEAVEHFRAAVALAPQDAKAHYNLGHALLVRGDSSEAVEHLARALQLDPGDATTHDELGSVYLAKQDFANAAHEFRESIRLSPRAAEAHNNLGIALASVGRVDEAVREFEIALQIDSRFDQARANLKAAQNTRRP
jgi:tetratricopeptide (TPR) repeat protein